MTMFIMAAIVLLLIYQVRKPERWEWLARGAPIGGKAERATRPAAEAAKPPSGSETAAPPPTPPAAAKTAKPAPAGPTDEDPEEQDFMSEARETIEDGSLHIKKEEMVPYQHVLEWVKNQPLAVLEQRARKDVLFDRFISDASQVRFKIVQVELDVRQVIKCDIKGPGGQEVYEIHGFSPEARLYYGIIEGLPEGMPVGTDVREQVLLVGYFFKVQGYFPVDSKSRSPLRAPMIIGRLDWQSLEPAPSEPIAGWIWAAIAGGCVLVVGVATALALLGGRRSRARSPGQGLRSAPPMVGQWLEQAQSGELDNDDKPPDGAVPGNNFPGNGESYKEYTDLGLRDLGGRGPTSNPPPN
jgi:hypothetical protein